MSTTQYQKDRRLQQILQDPDQKEIEQKMIKSILGMPKDVQDRFKALHMLSDKRTRLNDEFNDACNELEQKIQKKKQPLFDQRQFIISGQLLKFDGFIEKFNDTHLQLEKKVAQILQSGDQADEDEKALTDVSYLYGKKGIPDFWYRALKNNKMIWDTIKKRDEEIFVYIQNIETIISQNPKNQNMMLTLRLTFDKFNPFLRPNVLKLSLEYESENQVKKVKGMQILWTEGKDPTKKYIKKTQKHKKTGETRIVLKSINADSFFNLFKDRKAPVGRDSDSDGYKEEKMELDEIQQIVEDFHDLLIPDALDYYMGITDSFEMMGIDDDDYSDEDAEIEHDYEIVAKKHKKKQKYYKMQDFSQKPECKQQ